MVTVVRSAGDDDGDRGWMDEWMDGWMVEDEV